LKFIEKMVEPWNWNLVEGVANHSRLEDLHNAGRLATGIRSFQEAFSEHLEKMGSFDPSLIQESQGRSDVFLGMYAKWIRETGLKTISVERQFGIDTPVEFGGVRIAGHLDWEGYLPGLHGKTLTDWKFVGSRSQYRREKTFDLGMEMYKAGANAQHSALQCFVKDLKGGPKLDPLRFVKHDKGTRVAAEHIVAQTAEMIQKGDHPTAIAPGQGLCNPKYCMHFGRKECPATKHMKRKDYE